jgi:chromosome segregation ATPase
MKKLHIITLSGLTVLMMACAEQAKSEQSISDSEIQSLWNDRNDVHYTVAQKSFGSTQLKKNQNSLKNPSPKTSLEAKALSVSAKNQAGKVGKAKKKIGAVKGKASKKKRGSKTAQNQLGDGSSVLMFSSDASAVSDADLDNYTHLAEEEEQALDKTEAAANKYGEEADKLAVALDAAEQNPSDPQAAAAAQAALAELEAGKGEYAATLDDAENKAEALENNPLTDSIEDAELDSELDAIDQAEPDRDE